MRVWCCCVAGLLLACCSVGAGAPQGDWCVRDETGQDESLVKVRALLTDAVRRRDAGALRQALAPDIRSGELEGSPVGWREFDNRFKPSDARSYVWNEFAKILELPGRFEPAGTFCVPYTDCPGAPGSPEDVIVMREDVPAYSQPGRSSEVVARLSCQVLRASDSAELPVRRPVEPQADGWTAVLLPSGRWAYVEEQFVRFPGRGFLRFEKRDGRWVVIVYGGVA